MEFLRSIPGTVGGFVRMNGGAYGGEVKDILIDADVVLRSGERRTLPLADLGYTYRHSELPEGAVVIGATFRGRPGEPAVIQAEMDRISASREASQPLRSVVASMASTFAKAWPSRTTTPGKPPSRTIRFEPRPSAITRVAGSRSRKKSKRWVKRSAAG